MVATRRALAALAVLVVAPLALLPGQAGAARRRAGDLDQWLGGSQQLSALLSGTGSEGRAAEQRHGSQNATEQPPSSEPASVKEAVVTRAEAAQAIVKGWRHDGQVADDDGYVTVLQAILEPVRENPLTTAMLVATLAAVLRVIGFVMQKLDLQDPRNDDGRTGDISLTKAWMIGFALIYMAGFPLAMIQYSLAPVSLVAPFGGVTIVLNLVVAPTLLKEPVYCWPDVFATILITIGLVATSSVGSHGEATYGTPELLARLQDPAAMCLMLFFASLAGTCIYKMHRREKGQVVDPDSIYELLLPAVAASSMGLFNNMGVKAASIVFKTEPWTSCIPWLLVALPPGILQVNYQSRGTRLFPQTVFVPVYSALLLMIVTLGCGIFFREGWGLGADQLAVFVAGCFAITCGIILFACRPKEASKA